MTSSFETLPHKISDTLSNSNSPHTISPDRISPFQSRIENSLAQLLISLKTSPHCPHKLYSAIEYVLSAPGKYMRPNLVYLTGSLLGAPLAALDSAALAVELIHIYSLTHDDLPAMDNAALRRGQTTCHLQFDEATAILVGDALLPMAFQELAESNLPAKQVVSMIKVLAKASGAYGMVAGQVLDLDGEQQSYELTQINSMHQLKTGAMIEASVMLGVLTANCDDKEEIVKTLEHYSRCIGLAFQIQDDILDVCSDPKTLGKPTGLDESAGKSSYVHQRGLKQAKDDLNALYQQAIEALNYFPESAQKNVMQDFTQALFERNY